MFQGPTAVVSFQLMNDQIVKPQSGRGVGAIASLYMENSLLFSGCLSHCICVLQQCVKCPWLSSSMPACHELESALR